MTSLRTHLGAERALVEVERLEAVVDGRGTGVRVWIALGNRLGGHGGHARPAPGGRIVRTRHADGDDHEPARDPQSGRGGARTSGSPATRPQRTWRTWSSATGSSSGTCASRSRRSSSRTRASTSRSSGLRAGLRRRHRAAPTRSPGAARWSAASSGPGGFHPFLPVPAHIADQSGRVSGRHVRLARRPARARDRRPSRPRPDRRRRGLPALAHAGTRPAGGGGRRDARG